MRYLKKEYFYKLCYNRNTPFFMFKQTVRQEICTRK